MVVLAIACLAVLLYIYVGYPLLLWIVAAIHPKRWTVDETYEPTVSIILAAHNEGSVIVRCMESLLSLDYPSHKLEVLVGSDGSTDDTNALLSRYAERAHIICFQEQRGKMKVLNDLVPRAKNDILLFVDADVTLNRNAVLAHVRHYSDDSVGGVAGRLVIAAEERDGVFQSESTLLSIEGRLRKHEALIDSTVGLYGCNYSMRRALWSELPNSQVHDDFLAVLSIIDSGKRLVYDEEAVSTELYNRSLRDEFLRKTRGASRFFYTLMQRPHMLWRSRISWVLWSHKVLRFLTALFVAGLVAATVIGYIKGNGAMLPLLVFELLAGLIVLLGALATVLGKRLPVANQLYWFVYMNIAFTVGLLKFVTNAEGQTWSIGTRHPLAEDVESAAREAVHS